MHYHQLGSTDIQISAIIFGCWQAAWTGVESNDAADAVRAALDCGITTFDTAEAYGEGQSERVLADGIGDRRDEVVMATKVGANHLAPEQVIEACEGSLKNLGTDRIDLYQIHWPSGSWGPPVIPIADTLGALVSLKDQGKIRAIGLSNFDSAQIKEASALAPIESLQPPYSLFWRHVEADILPTCTELNISVLAYSPLAQGLLTGKFGRGFQADKSDVRSGNILFRGDDYERAQTALDKLKPIAERKGVSLGNLALAWILSRPNCFPIVGARNAQQARANADAGAIELSAAEIAEMETAGRIVTDHLDDNPVLWR